MSDLRLASAVAGLFRLSPFLANNSPGKSAIVLRSRVAIRRATGARTSRQGDRRPTKIGVPVTNIGTGLLCHGARGAAVGLVNVWLRAVRPNRKVPMFSNWGGPTLGVRGAPDRPNPARQPPASWCPEVVNLAPQFPGPSPISYRDHSAPAGSRNERELGDLVAAVQIGVQYYFPNRVERGCDRAGGDLGLSTGLPGWATFAL